MHGYRMKGRVLELLKNKDYNQLVGMLEKTNTADVSFLLDELKPEDMVVVYRLLSKNKAVETFSYMDPDTQENLINEFLNYPSDSVGSIMTIEFVDLKSSMTVADAFKRIKRVGVNKETIYTCYVLDNSRKLLGIVTVKEMLLAETNALIADIMETNLITVHTMEDKEEAAKKFDKYDLLALPVVDKENRLVGIITIDDAMEVLQEENTEDFAIMAARKLKLDPAIMAAPLITTIVNTCSILIYFNIAMRIL